jgi:hypothetical protein
MHNAVLVQPSSFSRLSSPRLKRACDPWSDWGCSKWHNLPEKANAIRGVRGLFRVEVEKTIVGHADASVLSALI